MSTIIAKPCAGFDLVRVNETKACVFFCFVFVFVFLTNKAKPYSSFGFVNANETKPYIDFCFV